MHAFTYRHGHLSAEAVPLHTIASEVGTPVYVYSSDAVVSQFSQLDAALASADCLICYALKANSSLAVIKTLGQLGSGVDVVSEGEIHRALAAGIDPGKIVFSGVGKTHAEMRFALEAGIFAFNVESEPELHALADVAASTGKTARAALRINPDVDAKTHTKITTGRHGDKFGIAVNDAARLFTVARSLPSIDLQGVHVHIGSQITQPEPYRDAFSVVERFVTERRREGHTVSFVNVGGGLGIPYRPETSTISLGGTYAPLVADLSRRLSVRLILEPGRILVGDAGVLLTRVIYVKESGAKRFVIVDAAMNDLVRPTLYDAFHDVWPLDEGKTREAPMEADLVGPVCETGDFLAKNRTLPPVRAGDLLAIMSAGAYGAVQSSTYNSRLLVPEVLVRRDQYMVTRPRPTYADMLKTERLPNWFA
jgi:diaminopimelate decarboxylase